MPNTNSKEFILCKLFTRGAADPAGREKPTQTAAHPHMTTLFCLGLCFFLKGISHSADVNISHRAFRAPFRLINCTSPLASSQRCGLPPYIGSFPWKSCYIGCWLAVPSSHNKDEEPDTMLHPMMLYITTKMES